MAVAALAAATAVTQGPRVARLSLGDLPGTIANTPSAVADLPARVVTEIADGRHLGFDTHSYPGDRAMRTWKATAPYEWVGYYLPAPCHADESWSGTRQKLEDMGWGTAVIYVGQQTWQGIRQPSRATVERARRDGTLRCHSSLVDAGQGTTEAGDAVARTAAEGFAEGTVIFLDIEYMDRTTTAMRDYARHWVRAVLADGRYRPGIYVHTSNAEAIFRDASAEYAAAGLAEEPPFWVAGGSKFDTSKTPRAAGQPFTAVWQGLLDVSRSWGGIRLPIDVNMAASPSPSSHEYMVSERYAAGD
ncbi:MAG: glycoside hydrolase domain-containing protein [Gemmatimonadaceae bacterium]